MCFRILCLFCLIFFGCSDLLELPDSPDPNEQEHLFDVRLAVHCERDMSCRSSVFIGRGPFQNRYYDPYSYFIAGKDTLLYRSGKFIDGADTLSSWNLPVTDGHVYFSFLYKSRRKDYDIDLAPWLGEISSSQDSVTLTNFEIGSEVCFLKVRGESYCQTIQERTEKITIPNDSSFYSFFKVQHNCPFDGTTLNIALTAYWR
ncbi:hypothetical protein [Fibrobacter intestinalis]|uniref:Lipoprotein n=1 Tax=Fibrobacter intestinalis TaxID=28122 RepID=A0A1T4MXT9_9BACT|nr:MULTISPECIES: hypothetical protein [Fibrobacter]PBC75150.1 hypothetical protein BGW94_2833 [Fibrobacter sp. NR9]SJZ71666.1 hypothetical protein SAMN02745108_01414 [Fibrobacter intestinalis]